MNNVFKVEDIITGLPGNKYGITNEYATLEVLSTHEINGTMIVKVISTTRPTNQGQVGTQHSVTNSGKKFRLLEQPEPIVYIKPVDILEPLQFGKLSVLTDEIIEELEPIPVEDDTDLTAWLAQRQKRTPRERLATDVDQYTKLVYQQFVDPTLGPLYPTNKRDYTPKQRALLDTGLTADLPRVNAADLIKAREFGLTPAAAEDAAARREVALAKARRFTEAYGGEVAKFFEPGDLDMLAFLKDTKIEGDV